MSGDGGRGAAALTAGICALAVVIYASNAPRDPMPLLLSPAAAGQPTADRPATPAAPPAPEVDLSVVVWPRGPGKGRTAWTLRCPPMTAACRSAIRRAQALARDDHGPCRRMRPRAPEAIIAGYVNGRYVTTWLDQRDGCGLAHWKELQDLLRRPEAPRGPNPA